MPNPDLHRKTELAKIHVAKAQLKLDDDTYRALLERLTGKTSAADLTARERVMVLNEFYRLGWSAESHRIPQRRPTPSTGSPSTGSGRAGGGGRMAGWGKDKLLSKIGALLAEAKRPWAYADGIARHMFGGVESVRFCDQEQLRKIVAALMYDQKRRKNAAPTPPEAA